MIQPRAVSLELQGLPRFIGWFPSIFDGSPHFFGAFPRFFGRFLEFVGPIGLISNCKILINYGNEPKIYGIRSKHNGNLPINRGKPCKQQSSPN